MLKRARSTPGWLMAREGYEKERRPGMEQNNQFTISVHRCMCTSDAGCTRSSKNQAFKMQIAVQIHQNARLRILGQIFPSSNTHRTSWRLHSRKLSFSACLSSSGLVFLSHFGLKQSEKKNNSTSYQNKMGFGFNNGIWGKETGKKRTPN